MQAAQRAEELFERRVRLAHGQRTTWDDVHVAEEATQRALVRNRAALSRVRSAYVRAASVHRRAATMFEDHGQPAGAERCREAAVACDRACESLDVTMARRDILADLPASAPKVDIETGSWPHSIAEDLRAAFDEVSEGLPCAMCGARASIRFTSTHSLCPDCGHMSPIGDGHVDDETCQHVWLRVARTSGPDATTVVGGRCALCGEVRRRS